MDSKANILVVDDEAIIAMDLSEQLSEFGYNIVGMAHSGEQALELIAKTKPDIVLMDIVLGAGMDGIRTAAMAKRYHQMPIIFLSAFSDPDTVSRAAQTAPYGYLTKPYQANELRAAIEVALTKAELEKALQESEAWFSSILKAVDDGIIAVEKDGRVRFINPTACQMLKVEADDIIGTQVEEHFSLNEHADTEALYHPAIQAIQQDRVLPIVFGGHMTAGKLSRRVDYTAAPIRDSQRHTKGAVLVMRDAEPRLLMETALKDSEERFQKAFMHSAVGLALVTLDGRLMQVNPAFMALLHIKKLSEGLILNQDLVSDLDKDKLREKLHQLLGGSVPAVQMELRFLGAGGKPKWMLTTISLILGEDAEPCYFIYQLNDLTERKEAELELHHLANFDDLTGLMNRPRLMKELNRMIVNAGINTSHFALIFIDLDHFKDINDSLGHAVGDRLLVEAAHRMRSSSRSSDILARLGGDEFVVLIPELRVPENAQRIADNLIQRLSQPFIIDKQELQLGASIGISVFPDDAVDADLLLQHADAALYMAKSEGRGLARFYSPEITSKLTRRLKLESALRHAIARQELYLEFQPISALPSMKVVGVEALVRWNYKDRVVSPGEFIPLAEKTQMIHEIGQWVLQAACTEVQRWHRLGHPLLLSVNVSPMQFRDASFVAQVEQALNVSELGSQYLILEITENTLSDTESSLQTLAKLRELGVSVAVDDFGTGYSSLSYLKLFNPQVLKIDQSFVRDLEHDQNDAAIVNATIAMGKQLGMKIVAEGVETQGQLQHLHEQGCDNVQGFLLGRPMTSEQLLELIREA
ncbi:EAL domain-containing protein [Gallaecimonas sp. GXIMD4217]|uniref:two-component system response regulator n=1 Tax=Gallaecimonas sp. GXIMD4217 TaxID=3131927 RepID=UPI00311B1D57